MVSNTIFRNAAVSCFSTRFRSETYTDAVGVGLCLALDVGAARQTAYFRLGKKKCTSCPSVFLRNSDLCCRRRGSQKVASFWPQPFSSGICSGETSIRYLECEFSEVYLCRNSIWTTYLTWVKTCGSFPEQYTSALQLRGVHLTVSHRYGDVSSRRNLLATFKVARLCCRFSAFKFRKCLR